MRTHLRRLCSLALLLALVGGGVGLPLFDALVFHTPGRAAPPERTLAAPGSAAGHTQVCVLGRLAPHSRGLPALPVGLAIHTVEQVAEPFQPSALPVSKSGPTLQQSRAPPALLA
jgi:hypothetical protein